jgi:signal transduction histidine kinase
MNRSMSEPNPARRALLVDTVDDERRRIERALHDGIQQDLVAVSVRVQLARRLAETDVPATLAVLDEVIRDVRDSLDAIRDLADEVYPSLLEGRGLVEALQAAGASVAAPGVGRYQARVEAAIYFCARSLLDAAAAHLARITIREENGALLLAADAESVSLRDVESRLVLARERVEVLGGTMSVEPARSGLRLTATVPTV